ncbi:hypothetical protein QQX98_010103 [Neonectria punicea]|uniref:Zn(2)-C6 fungal-type domain-containing protein n=1 Tax=Neonectria punicea TaxID=979145 RepID=A0ABR1GQS6_9HYPO
MVTPAYYPSVEGRRNNNRVEAYPSSYPERRHGAYPVHPDPRASPMGETDDASPQRKRIAVACGRCRKRKIRCSGDTGNGMPCYNCKNAGFDPCLYLRVASQETQLKHESYSYSVDASRQYHSRGSTVVPTQPPQYDGLAYRPGPSTFAYHGRPFDAASTWASNMSVEQQGVNYGAYPPPYHAVQQAHQDSDLNLTSFANLVHRAAAHGHGTATARCSFENVGHVAATMPGPIHTGAAVSAASPPPSVAVADIHDRILPVSRVSTPAGRAALVAAGGTPYRNESSSPAHGRSSQSSASSAAPMTPSSDASASGFANYESSSSMSNAASSYPPMGLAAHLSRSSDLYAPTGTSESAMYSAGTSAGESMRSSGSGPDMTYRYTDTTTSGTGSPVATITTTHMNSRGATGGGLTSSHAHHGSSFVPQNHGEHASYMMSGDAGGASDADDSDSKVAGLRT